MAQREVDPARTNASGIRVATRSDLDHVAATLAGAFATDPVWSWALPHPREQEIWWRFLVGSALRYPCVWTTGGYGAVSVWIPPNGTELTEEEVGRVEPLLTKLIGPRASAVMELLERFEGSHPGEPEHYYLSLLGTHPNHRGRGLGMALLAENLARTDAEGLPTYLESSNPANDRRYESLGFRQIGEFTTPGGEHSLTTMWREVGGAE